MNTNPPLEEAILSLGPRLQRGTYTRHHLNVCSLRIERWPPLFFINECKKEINNLQELLRLADSDLTQDEQELFYTNFNTYKRFIKDGTHYTLEGTTALQPR